MPTRSKGENQATPKAQAIVYLQSVWGHLDNMAELVAATNGIVIELTQRFATFDGNEMPKLIRAMELLQGPDTWED